VCNETIVVSLMNLRSIGHYCYMSLTENWLSIQTDTISKELYAPGVQTLSIVFIGITRSSTISIESTYLQNISCFFCYSTSSVGSLYCFFCQ
jgi:hypothetical protein